MARCDLRFVVDVDVVVVVVDVDVLVVASRGRC